MNKYTTQQLMDAVIAMSKMEITDDIYYAFNLGLDELFNRLDCDSFVKFCEKLD